MAKKRDDLLSRIQIKERTPEEVTELKKERKGRIRKWIQEPLSKIHPKVGETAGEVADFLLPEPTEHPYDVGAMLGTTGKVGKKASKAAKDAADEILGKAKTKKDIIEELPAPAAAVKPMSKKDAALKKIMDIPDNEQRAAAISQLNKNAKSIEEKNFVNEIWNAHKNKMKAETGEGFDKASQKLREAERMAPGQRSFHEDKLRKTKK